MTGSKVGLYYGRESSNLPNATHIVKLYKDSGYSKMWVSEADKDILLALDNQGIEVILGIPNSKIQELAADVFAASNWVDENITPHETVAVTHICVGDLSNMVEEVAMSLLRALKNINEAVKANGLNIKVSTLVDDSNFTHKYDIATNPSHCSFKSPNLFKAILRLLKDHDTPLFLKIMPYFEMAKIPFGVKVTDDNFLLKPGASKFLTDQDGTEYNFVFDAMVDSFLGASKALGFDGIKIVVASGWPRAARPGDTNATPQYAKTYNANLKNHIEYGTPKNGKKFIETFLWSAFDEDKLIHHEEGRKHLGAFVFGWNNMTLP